MLGGSGSITLGIQAQHEIIAQYGVESGVLAAMKNVSAARTSHTSAVPWRVRNRPVDRFGRLVPGPLRMR